jgi:uncharacterized protein (TIGR02001 family)
MAGAGTTMRFRTISRSAAALAALLGLACAPVAAKDKETDDKGTADAVETTIGASVLSDYRYRGISLTRLRPSASASFEVARDGFYVGGLLYAVRLPGSPVAELTGTAGIRRTLAGIDFDLWAEAYYYPGETPAPGDGATNYWQANLKGSRKFDGFELIGQFGYSPTVWNSGAWGVYGSGVLNFDMPTFKLPSGDIDWKLVGELGYQSFGTTSLGSQLPDYAHWRLGTVFTRGEWSLEVSAIPEAGASWRIPTACARISAAAPPSRCCRSSSARRSSRPTHPISYESFRDARQREPGIQAAVVAETKKAGFRVPPTAAPE